MVKKKLHLQNQAILSVEAFLVHKSGTTILRHDFLRNDGSEQY